MPVWLVWSRRWRYWLVHIVLLWRLLLLELVRVRNLILVNITRVIIPWWTRVLGLNLLGLHVRISSEVILKNRLCRNLCLGWLTYPRRLLVLDL
jgi:hypothetical protein